MTTLADWVVARIVTEYDFPVNAAEAIVAQQIRSERGGYSPPWNSDIANADKYDTSNAWDAIIERVKLMAQTDLDEAIKFNLLDPLTYPTVYTKKPTPKSPKPAKHAAPSSGRSKPGPQPGVIYDGKDQEGYRYLTVHAPNKGDLDNYAAELKVPGRRVVCRHLRQNIWRIFTEAWQ